MPHSVILPLVDERETFDFQVSAENLPQFSIDFSIYPTFGSKVIGKAVVLFSSFDHVNSHQTFVAPLLDHQLKTIGEVSLPLLQVGLALADFAHPFLSCRSPSSLASYGPSLVSSSRSAARSKPTGSRRPSQPSLALAKTTVGASSRIGRCRSRRLRLAWEVRPLGRADRRPRSPLRRQRTGSSPRPRSR